MIDSIAAILGMIGSALNMNLSSRLQTYGLALWFVSDLILVIWAWDKSAWVVGMMGFYMITCTIGIWKRWDRA